MASQDSSIAEQVNNLFREVFAAGNLSVQLQHLHASDPAQLCLVGWSDAALANRPDLASTGGCIVGLMDPECIKEGFGKVSPVLGGAENSIALTGVICLPMRKLWPTLSKSLR